MPVTLKTKERKIFFLFTLIIYIGNKTNSEQRLSLSHEIIVFFVRILSIQTDFHKILKLAVILILFFCIKMILKLRSYFYQNNKGFKKNHIQFAIDCGYKHILLGNDLFHHWMMEVYYRFGISTEINLEPQVVFLRFNEKKVYN